MNNLTKAVSSAAEFSTFLSFMPNPDVILSKNGLRLSIFDEMLADAHISAKLEQLRHGVLAYEWSIIPADSTKEAAKTADYVRRNLKDMPNFLQELEEMLSAVEYGFSVTEIVWRKEGAHWLAEKLLNRNPARFLFDSEGGLFMADGGGKTELDEKYKFIIHRHMPRNENPYGSPVLSKCYWPWMFKKAGFRFWLTVAEKFGVPTVLAMFNSDGGEETRRRAQALAESLSGIQNDAAVALANVEKVQVLESRGSSEDFAKLIEVCNGEISKAVTGEILTSDTGSGASYALAKEHSRTFGIKAAKTAASLAGTVNSTLVRWIAELNFGSGCKLPSFVFEEKKYADWTTIREAAQAGMDVDFTEAARRFGIPLK
ncbi:DUF935 family protein [Geovibrio thiophilus]|uniref:DUF935 family protein n=1 Tax=Geovibrio thiophilus TaxID=139438 RepID=A0A410K1L8_9BACT|nr:DUF935 family protein [Geovibrio thiophilus]QAR34138.1 DUF935 family protein [Geovibrio thiophilus]